MLSHQRTGSSTENDLCNGVQPPRSTSLSLLSTSCFICELQGCASSEWNDLLTGTPPSTHAHFIWASAEHTVTESTPAAQTPQSCFTCGSTLTTSATITAVNLQSCQRDLSSPDTPAIYPADIRQEPGLWRLLMVFYQDITVVAVDCYVFFPLQLMATGEVAWRLNTCTILI